MNNIDVFCDESCHLENDESEFMVLGATYCRKFNTKKIYNDIKKIKLKHNFSTDYEIKWTKITKSNLNLAKDLIKYFFENPKLRFRGYVIDKTGLNHEKYNQTHDTWYYKMFYQTLTFIIEDGFHANIYLDIKDTQSANKTKELHRILNIPSNPFSYGKVNKVQGIQSHESQILQITDLIIGALRYNQVGLKTSQNKLDLVELIKEESQQNLNYSTKLNNLKFNIFHWNSKPTKKGW